MSGQTHRNKESNKPKRRTKGAGEKSKSQINADYFRSLERWMDDFRGYKATCDLLNNTFYAAFYQYQFNKFQLGVQTRINNINVNNINVPPPVPPFPTAFNLYNVFNMAGQDPHEDQRETERDGASDFIIPPLWKRFIAEILDFFLLFLMKLAVTYVAVDFFDFVNLNKYESMIPDGMDYSVIFELTSEILILELLHRLIVCLYEGIFLYKAMQNGVGGATPGKTIMGLRVIYCTSIHQGNRPNVVKVSPATDIGLAWSFARACLKNLVLALLIPICFPFFFNKFNRSSYDILCHTLVVEEVRPGDRNEHEQ